MRILEINKFYNSKRGADKHFIDLIALLKENGHEVAEFSMFQEDNNYSRWNKYFLSKVGYGSGFSLWEKIKGAARMFYSFEAKRKINAILDEFKPDIVHIHNIYHQISPAILFEIKKRGIPVVMTVHDYKLINPNHSLYLDGKPYQRCANGKYYQCFFDKCVKNSYAKSFLASLEMYWHRWLGTYGKNIDLYIAPSKFVKTTLVKWNISAEKIIVLPHFIPFRKKDSKRYSFAVADKYAIYPGKISKEKGVDALIQIFLKQKGLKLYLAGEIEDGFEIPNHPNIVYLGFLKADQLKEYVRNSACIVSGSRLPETFGLIAIEAMVEGKPFLGFDSGAYGEIIENELTGYIAKSDEEFAEFLKKMENGSVIFNSDEIKKHVKKYDPENYCKNLIQIFKNIIDETNTKRKNIY
ncbi:MAG TPA: glycosyltransferase [Candidatus Moranbacteria bacterium]|nr:glycosyltransferase family 4 protein [Candidatus Moranbacteria bacterium]HOF42456.1 glycosyltransferase [Candidatus Moranbacteria bacterium]HPX94134.1 glycosyltransferase [Candidatus Moranbacteria bacterium]HQB59194.1 glycosyltransferase [Candidatus Moranbacteria bacterium]